MPTNACGSCHLLGVEGLQRSGWLWGHPGTATVMAMGDALRAGYYISPEADTLALPSIGCTLLVSAIYQRTGL